MSLDILIGAVLPTSIGAFFIGLMIGRSSRHEALMAQQEHISLLRDEIARYERDVIRLTNTKPEGER